MFDYKRNIDIYNEIYKCIYDGVTISKINFHLSKTKCSPRLKITYRN